MAWGDMDENGKPISMDKGRLYRRWVDNVKKYGYNFDHRVLNAADFGAYTSRKRFFGIFAKKGLPIVFPEATHAKKAQHTLFGSLKKWEPVKDVLDLSDKGRSIFKRNKPLVEPTEKRIYDGLVEHIGTDFITAYYGNGNNIRSLEYPAAMVTTKDRLALISPKLALTSFPERKLVFLDQQFGKSKPASVELPCGAITTNPKYALVSCEQQVKDNTVLGDLPPFIRQDGDTLVYQVYESDTPTMQKIKSFMALHGIVDICMRMLKITELKKIMGFPENYVLVGTQSDQKKFIGNAVEVNMARVLCEALCKRLNELNVPVNKTEALIQSA